MDGSASGGGERRMSSVKMIDCLLGTLGPAHIIDNT
jgi:hypothetical protein